MQEAYEIVARSSEKQHIRDKNRLDGRKQAQPLEEGNRVLVKNKETGGPGKLRSFWEDKVMKWLITGL